MTCQQPILIAGAGSSGSSLLRQLLRRHSKIAIGPELSVFNKESFYTCNYGEIAQNAKKILERGMCTKGWFSYQGTFLGLDEYGWSKKDLLHCIKFCSSQKELMDTFFDKYLSIERKTIWCEKTPSNSYCLNYFLKLYPKCKIIHIYRDGRDSVASLIKRGMDPYFATMAWLYNTASAIKLRGCDNYYEVKYEMLVTNPKKILEQLCDFLDVTFEDQMLRSNPSETRRKINSWNNSPYSEISSSSIGKHVTFFSPFHWYVFDSAIISKSHIRKYGLTFSSTAFLQKVLGYQSNNRQSKDIPHIYKIRLLKLYINNRIRRFILDLRIDKNFKACPGSIKL